MCIRDSTSYSPPKQRMCGASCVVLSSFGTSITIDHSRFTWVFLLALKSECYHMFVNFYNMIQTQFAKNIKKVRSDNGGEFLSTNLTSFFKLRGIVHNTSCAYSPQQNGVVERKHQHLLSVAKALHLQANLPINL